MDFLKNLLIDGLNGFSLSFVPLFLFQVLSAALMAHVFQLYMNRKTCSDDVKYGALISSAVCILCAIVKYSLPFSVLASALILTLFKGPVRNLQAGFTVFVIALIGLGCGVGSVIQTFIGFCLLFLIALFTPTKKDE